ncbi:hypothetical protein ABW20_dc0108592 [Dactylellina cionopaga]|nr:hypothetical protein ABW20_dc0108592 [Dactylellina cionopaga]
MPEVMCMFACNGQNKVANNFNPGPMRLDENFAILGEKITAYPGDPYGLRNGTSYSTFVGAGIAALLLDFYRQGDISPQMKYYEKLRRVVGMRAVFLAMAEHGASEGYNCIVPWEFLQKRRIPKEEERIQIFNKITGALGRRR